MGSLGCIGRVFFTSLNFPREVWFPVQGLYAKHSVWWVLYLLSQHQHQPSTKASAWTYRASARMTSPATRVKQLNSTKGRTDRQARQWAEHPSARKNCTLLDAHRNHRVAAPHNLKKPNIQVLSRRVILLGGTTKKTRQGLFSKSCLCFAGKENYTCSQRPCCSLFDRLPSPGNSFTHTARHNSMTFKTILIGKAED